MSDPHPLKVKGDALSFAKLLDQMSRCAGQITFEFYQVQFPRNPNDVDWQSVAFAALSHDGKTLAADIIDRDRLELEQIPDAIEGYADRALAHLDPRGFHETFTFDDLESAIRRFDHLVCRYEVFLTSAGAPTLKAVVPYPWQRIFDVPLRAPG